ncbi:MAG: hypothetical protein QOG34_1147, partial [Frankiaceae bacterium]|nr:hypothetical protein [Frankiaceae bacterium]
MTPVATVEDVTDAEPPAYSFEAFYRAKIRAALRLAALLGADDPEDVAQESMTRVEPHLARLPNDAVRTAYLRRAVVNLTRDRWRRQQRATARHPNHPVSTPGAEEAA